jgi:hypothetical protein
MKTLVLGALPITSGVGPRGQPAARMAGSTLGITWTTSGAMQRFYYVHIAVAGCGIPGGSHGVQFRPSSQPVSCRHQVRDRGKASRGRSGASVQPASGISRRHVPAVAGPAGKAKSSHIRAAPEAIAFTGPLTPARSANGLGVSGRPGHWRMGAGALANGTRPAT